MNVSECVCHVGVCTQMCDGRTAVYGDQKQSRYTSKVKSSHAYRKSYSKEGDQCQKKERESDFVNQASKQCVVKIL